MGKSRQCRESIGLPVFQVAPLVATAKAEEAECRPAFCDDCSEFHPDPQDLRRPA